MKRKDIENAAGNYSGSILGLKGNAIKAEFKAFANGAAWRINSVWHDAEIQPQDNKMILTLDDKNYPIIAGPLNDQWKETVDDLNIKRWAYIEDLIPNKEE